MTTTVEGPRLLRPGTGPGLVGHVALRGPLPARGRRLVDEVEAAGLRGKGGAGFPAAVKMAAAAAGPRRPLVVANGTEGEPASAKDALLLCTDPHLVLDGVAAVAEAVEAAEAVVCVKRSAVTATRTLRRALSERADAVRIDVALVPDGYVAGEESALLRFLASGDSRPVWDAPRPAHRDVPATVHNVETLAHVALIARHGSEWYRRAGTPDEPGTTLLTVVGGPAGPVVHEVALGTPLGVAVADATGLRVADAAAVLVGGYFGTWMTGSVAATAPLSHAGLRAVGGSLGCGVVAVVPAGRCPVAELAAVTAWMAGESVGQCGPCANGLPAIAGAVAALQQGRGSAAAERDLRRWLDMVEGRGACRHPDGTARMVRSAMRTMTAELAEHARQGPCAPQPPILPVPEHPPTNRKRRS